MRKYIVIFIILFLIVIISIVGSILVIPNNEIKKNNDILEVQRKLETGFSCYGYTIDNPNIVVNPFKIAPLSALIMFESKDNIKVGVYLENKDGNRYMLYEEESETKEHYLDIYNLYANYDNKVILIVNENVYEYVVTTKLNNKTVIRNMEEESLYNKLVNNGDSLVLVDGNNDILFYFDGYVSNLVQLDNGHLLVTSKRKNNDGSYVGFSEIDLLGKIYNDYIIEDGFYDKVFVMENGNYFVLSNDLLELDRQNGKILKRFDVDGISNILDVQFDIENNNINVIGESSVCSYDYKSQKLNDCVDNVSEYENEVKEVSFGNYYKKYKQNRFGFIKKTNVSDKKIGFLLYKKKDSVYNDCQLDFVEEYDRLVVKKECNKDVYIILDKFLEKKIYEIDQNTFYINKKGLLGKYSIYVMIDDNIYKSGYFVNIK